MTSIIKLQAISGAHDTSPPCYLLQVDEFKFLLDCGWNEHFDMEHINKLTKLVPTIDAVLLSHPDPLHLGALPYLVGKCGLNCAIYATAPVCKMGEMFMYDLHQSRHNYEEFDLFSLDDIDLAFEKVTQIKYNQSLTLSGKGHGLVITAMPSGHTIGGTIWKIIKDDEEDIIYAIDYNHKKERHLNPCDIDTILRPSLLITDCFNALYHQKRRSDRDRQLMESILETMKKGGNVLIAVDTAGRILELAYMLEQLWRAPHFGLMTYSLSMLNTVAYNVIEFAKSQVEWMSDKVMKSFEGHRSNPFSFRHLKLLHSMAELNKIKEPKVVLATQPDLECGFSRELFLRWASNPNNRVILTQRSSPFTLASKLIEIASGSTARNENSLDDKKRLITLEVKQRVELDENELEEYEERQRIKKELEDIKNFKNKFKEEDDDFDSEEEETEEPMEVAAEPQAPVKTGQPLVEKTEKKPLSSASYWEHLKHSINIRKAFPMYPLVEHKIRWDDYGELINPRDYELTDKKSSVLRNTEVDHQLKDNTQDDPMLTEDQIVANDIPTKCIIKLETFSVNAKLEFIDFEGRSDGESIKKIIERIKPRRLILVRGDEQATSYMHALCVKNLNIGQDKIFIPSSMEQVDATTERNIYQVRLKDSLVSSLRFSKAKDGAELCWVEAAIEFEDVADLQEDESRINESRAEKLDRIQNANRDNLPTLRPLTEEDIGSHRTIFVNELKLSDFKQVLIRKGIQAEFHGGVLYINNKVCVRRNETGRINLEGTICEDYFKVRKLLYEQYAII